MGASVGGNEDFNSEINVTPMVDIMLVLLIIFMVVTPSLQEGVGVKLPTDAANAEEDENVTAEGSIVVSIPSTSQIYVGSQEYPFDQLIKKNANNKAIFDEDLGANLIKTPLEQKTDAERIVYIKSDKDLNYGAVVDVVNALRGLGVDRIGLITDKKKE